jgi:hypothetical protein
LPTKLQEKEAEEQKIEEIRKIDKLARDLYKFFKHSPKKCLDFEKFARIKNKAYKFLKVYDIRWLSKFDALENIMKNMENLLD